MKNPARPEDLIKRGTTETFAPSLPAANVMPLREPGEFKIEAYTADKLPEIVSRPYFIKGMVEPRQVSIWYGQPGGGKTFLMLHLSDAIARGADWFFGRRVKPAATLYCALEGRGGIATRIHAITKSMGTANTKFHCAPHGLELLIAGDRGGARRNMAHIDALASYIREHSIGLVVIDTLNLTLGGADENDNSAMGQLIGAAGELATSTGAHVALVAHAPKGDPKTGPRGGSAQMGNADMVVAISGEGDRFSFSTFATDGGKIKDGAPFKLYAKLDPIELAVDEDGDPITSCTVEEMEAPAAATSNVRLTPELQSAFREICDLLVSPDITVDIAPKADMSTLRCVTPRQINEHWIKTGRLDTEADTPSSVQKKGQRLRNKLRDLGKIGLTDKWVWLVEQADR